MYNKDEQDLINRINYNKENNSKLISREFLDFIYKKVTNKILRVNDSIDNKNEKSTNKEYTMQQKVDLVIKADKNLRAAVSELASSLAQLNDKDIALKLIGEHIIMLNEIFKQFEKM